MLRRTLIAALPSAVALAALAGCAGAGRVTPASVATDVVLIDTGLNKALANVPGLSSATSATIGAALADLSAVATAIGSADTVAAAQPLVARVEADVNSVVAALSGLPLPPQVSAVLTAATVLLPVIETAVGMIAPAAASPAMTPANARAVLAHA